MGGASCRFWRSCEAGELAKGWIRCPANSAQSLNERKYKRLRKAGSAGVGYFIGTVGGRLGNSLESIRFEGVDISMAWHKGAAQLSLAPALNMPRTEYE